MVYPDKSVGIAGFGLDEQDLFQSATDLHARPIRETSLKSGKTVTYSVPQSKLDGLGPYEISTVVCKIVHKFASVWCKTALGEVGVSLPR